MQQAWEAALGVDGQGAVARARDHTSVTYEKGGAALPPTIANPRVDAGEALVSLLAASPQCRRRSPAGAEHTLPPGSLRISAGYSRSTLMRPQREPC